MDTLNPVSALPSPQLLHELLERTPDLVLCAGADGRLAYLNPAGRRMLGYGPAEPVGHLTAEDLHPRWAYEQITEEAMPAASRLQDWTAESAMLTRDGREIPVSLIAVAHCGPTGRVTFYSAIARDITGQKRREDALRLLAEASEVLHSSLDYDSTLQTVARLAVERVADYCLVDVHEPDGTIRRVATAHVDPAREALLREAAAYPPDLHGEVPMTELLAAGRPLLIDDTSDAWLRRVAADDRHLALIRELAPRQMIMAPMIARGQVRGSLWLTAVRPERRFGDADVWLAGELAARAALAVDNARLYGESQRALRLRDEVLGVVAHDLRSPVATAFMASSFLAELLPHAPGSVEQKQLAIIKRAADRMNRLIQDLLEVHRIEAGQLALEQALAPVDALVDDAWEELHPLARAASLRLDREIAPDLPPVVVDRGRIMQVLSNLVSNAVKFTPAGGRVTLRAEGDGDDRVRLCVCDTGPGIPPDQLRNLFVRFWQADRRDRRGAGLGLAIVKGIVEAHGGAVFAESEPGRGTTIAFTLPAEAPRVAGGERRHGERRGTPARVE